MECQLKNPSLQNKEFGLLTNKAMSGQALVVVDHTVKFEPAKEIDPKQIWTKFYMMKDNQWVFMLVNGGKNVMEDGKAVKALQHSQGPYMPVRVVDLYPKNLNLSSNTMDTTLLWTDNDGGNNGFMVIRESKDNQALVLGAKNRNLVVGAKYCEGGDSQLWKFVVPQPPKV